MSEFGPSPETNESKIAELREIYTELNNLENLMARVENGNLEESGNEEAVRSIRERQNVLKQRAYKLHLELKDFEAIRGAFIHVIEATYEEREELGMPYYIEEVADETFALETDDKDSVEPTVRAILESLTAEYNLHTFEDENEE